MQKRIKILVITPFYYPHWGGSERYIEQLYSAVMKNHRNVQVDLLTYDTKKTGRAIEIYKKIKIYRIQSWDILPGQFVIPNYFELFKLLKSLRNNSYDILNSHTRFFDNSWWGPIAADYLGAKSILTDHCANHPIHKSHLVRSIAKVADYIFMKHITKWYGKVTSTSIATMHFLFDHGVKSVQVISNGIKIDDDHKNNLKSGMVRIVFAGRMIDSKGPEMAVDVAQKIVKDNRNAQFIFAGDGPLLSRLKKKAVKNRIVFTGALHSSQVKKLLNDADIFIYPSTHHDGLPSILLEAGIAKCAVVSTNSGGSSDVIKHNSTGIIADSTLESFERAIRLLVSDSKLRRRFGNELYDFVRQNFDWENISNQYYRLLRSMV